MAIQLVLPCGSIKMLEQNTFKKHINVLIENYKRLMSLKTVVSNKKAISLKLRNILLEIKKYVHMVFLFFCATFKPRPSLTLTITHPTILLKFIFGNNNSSEPNHTY